MATWHLPRCRRPQVMLVDDVPYCDNCSEMFNSDEWQSDSLVSSLPPLPPGKPPGMLNLEWPSPDLFDAVSSLPMPEGSSNNLDASQEVSPSATNNSKHQDGSTTSSGMQKSLTEKVEDSIYQPYPIRNPSDIRLLILTPAYFDAPLHGQLRLSSLEDSPNTEFEALSYTWADANGDKARSKTLFLTDAWLPLFITSNCEAALKRLRDEVYPRLLWVDAICINQRASEEKNHQVKLMQTIYSTAKEVSMFVGENDKSSFFALDTIFRLHHKDVEKELREKKLDSERLCSVQKFLSRPYFTRLWILQEIMNARAIRVHCGGNAGPFYCLQPEWTKGTDIELPAWLSKLGPIRTEIRARHLVEILNVTSNCRCSDPRDKVFALLGFINDSKDQGLVPRYDLSVEEVYIGAATYILKTHPECITDLLLLTARKKEASEAYDRLLPSWVPRLDIPSMEILPFVKSTQESPAEQFHHDYIAVDKHSAYLTLSGFHYGRNIVFQEACPITDDVDMRPEDSFLFVTNHHLPSRSLCLHIRRLKDTQKDIAYYELVKAMETSSWPWPVDSLHTLSSPAPRRFNRETLKLHTQTGGLTKYLQKWVPITMADAKFRRTLAPSSSQKAESVPFDDYLLLNHLLLALEVIISKISTFIESVRAREHQYLLKFLCDARYIVENPDHDGYLHHVDTFRGIYTRRQKYHKLLKRTSRGTLDFESVEWYSLWESEHDLLLDDLKVANQKLITAELHRQRKPEVKTFYQSVVSLFWGKLVDDDRGASPSTYTDTLSASVAELEKSMQGHNKRQFEDFGLKEIFEACNAARPRISEVKLKNFRLGAADLVQDPDLTKQCIRLESFLAWLYHPDSSRHQYIWCARLLTQCLKWHEELRLRDLGQESLDDIWRLIASTKDSFTYEKVTIV